MLHSLDAPLSLTLSISSLSSLMPASTLPPLSPSLSSSLTLATSTVFLHPHGHALKNVHFLSQDTDITTVKIFNHSTRPMSLLFTNASGAGEGGKESGNKTETETEGKESRTGGFGGFGGFGGRQWGAWGRWGSVGRSASAGAGAPGGSAATGGGARGSYPFPKVAASVRRSQSSAGGGGGNCENSRGPAACIAAGLGTVECSRGSKDSQQHHMLLETEPLSRGGDDGAGEDNEGPAARDAAGLGTINIVKV
ncbi:hypothetical protein CVT25_004521 [Psilocybe cyanescens]|uniref:Uncharacterized protein n=1 Tax=Psilocybe cyanescens TaxID=93625 RepID=A0A409XRV7_PSICY|nr:hypothetical protein CVT25_004521 [Psilocybe cyanescens]